MVYVHATFDVVRAFLPRVPLTAAKGEDKTIPRICASVSLRDAVKAIPQSGRVVDRAKLIGFEPVIHAYYLQPAENGLMDNEVVQNYVPDARYTKEVWLTKPPEKMFRADFIVRNAITKEKRDANGDCHGEVLFFDPVRTRHTDNWELLTGALGSGLTTKKRELLGRHSFRDFMLNLDGVYLEAILEKAGKTA